MDQKKTGRQTTWDIPGLDTREDNLAQRKQADRPHGISQGWTQGKPIWTRENRKTDHTGYPRAGHKGGQFGPEQTGRQSTKDIPRLDTRKANLDQ